MKSQRLPSPAFLIAFALLGLVFAAPRARAAAIDCDLYPNSPACSCNSPVVIDVDGKGIQLTDAANGVMFDIAGRGHPIKIAWTAPGTRNAWLALDRNGNGAIDNGKELFGNYTQQPTCPNPNGFLALAEYDKLENGGNGDGFIDNRDSIFPLLRLWIDANHNGVSEREELFTPSGARNRVHLPRLPMGRKTRPVWQPLPIPLEGECGRSTVNG